MNYAKGRKCTDHLDEDQDGWMLEPGLSDEFYKPCVIVHVASLPGNQSQYGEVMAEPATSAAGGIAAWKLAGSILGIGVVVTMLGFLVLWPKTMKEAMARALATLAGSTFIGPVLVIAAYSKYPELFAAGAKLAGAWGYDPFAGHFMVAAPLLAMAGLPFWWLLGAGVLWLDRRKGKDIGELAKDAAADAKAVLP